MGGFRFHRELKIPPHVVDFACLGRKLVVELAGEDPTDELRTRALEDAGYRIVRLRELDVLDEIELLLRVILRALAEPRPR